MHWNYYYHLIVEPDSWLYGRISIPAIPPFDIMHIPALVVAFMMTFGGINGLLDANRTMRNFGLPHHIASSHSAASVFRISCARTTVIGLLLFYFYLSHQLAVVDTILTFTGAYCGLIDSNILLMEENAGDAMFRLFGSWIVAAWGYYGLTTEQVRFI
ncbi:hypothetical protein F5B22DRAFT_436126 [Xylaria bambusicola]|uniref:uncharacterized protein n=1 Tax=Xylaria bambusicola TaxID=326684 RepID=UPI00200825AA|nr:uncharacterized protein F5B22DRAFT_436126 [Xylaria bambusicola]KAI0506751.1 hypothetical protein F5B22DRAFT_436126 [Xylaria bambusicola]